jgi:hypothetical protein
VGIVQFPGGMSSAAPLALSRTCNLDDFPGCLSVAAWQQRLADQAWSLWTHAQHLRTRAASLVVNGAGIEFLAPGPSAIYCTAPEEAREVASTLGVPAVFALSVLDHIEAPVSFLTQAAGTLKPQGLLFLTFAYWDAEGPDTAAGCDERRRIYSAHSYQRLIREARKAGFETFGGTDWRYHGHYLDDHSLASLVLTRRPERRSEPR